MNSKQLHISLTMILLSFVFNCSLSLFTKACIDVKFSNQIEFSLYDWDLASRRESLGRFDKLSILIRKIEFQKKQLILNYRTTVEIGNIVKNGISDMVILI